MRTIRPVLFAIAMLSSTFALAGPPAAADESPICFTARLGSGLGAARVDFQLVVEPEGPFLELLGEARFSQPVAPPGNLIVYSVTGTAIPNADGLWASLSGVGYDVAKTVYRGTFAIQLSVDPAKQTFSYTRQNLDGSGATTSSSSLPLTLCTP